ncbi:MAG: WHG domain-containing protein, partial [Gemmatimonadota bacterium]|nr:WHG domain-containing protein [Gemmatimonadota bacterium]
EAAVAYILFAADQPELFRVMFGPQLADEAAYPTLRSSARAAYRTIEDGLARCLPPSSESISLESMAVGSWALIHGLAVLVLDGQISAATPAEVERLAREITEVLWSGLSSAIVTSGEKG